MISQETLVNESVLDRLMRTAPNLEIWWDSSPLVYPSWSKSLIARFPPEQQESLAAQLRRLYDPQNPAATLFTGVTTNPPLSYQAIQDDPARWTAWVEDYSRRHPNLNAEQIAWELYKEIVRQGALQFLPVFERTDYAYGHLSAQVNPYAFFDAEAMFAQALELNALAPNITIKIPGSYEGVQTVRELTALGISTNLTSGYIVPQFIAVAEAVQSGLLEARENGVDLSRWRSVITYMSARWENEPVFVEQAQQHGVTLSEEDRRWAGVAIFKNAYRIFRQRRYPSKLLICSLRLGPRVDDVMQCWHIQETAGGQVIFTMPPPFLTELFTEGSHLTFEPRIRKEIPADVMERLLKVPYFSSAISTDGVSPEEFNEIPALLSTMNQFRAALDKIVAFTEEVMSQRKEEPVSA